MLREIEALPPGFLDAAPETLEALLGGPTLIHLRGRRQPALFVSVLLHGNESTGLLAIQALLRHYQERELPRDLSIFVGNVSAARHGQRRLEGQHDYNRVWNGGESEEHRMMAQILERMNRRGLFASIDIHNNTGLNPHYACVNRLDNPFLQLATMFSRTTVYFTEPEGVQSMAFSRLCPAVTLECGQPGQPHGTDHACEYVDACLNLLELPPHPVAEHDLNIFHTVATVYVPEDVSFSFGETTADLEFLEDIDHFNFSELPSGTRFGWQRNAGAQLHCLDLRGNDVSERYFSYDDGTITLAQPLMPSMLTLNEQVIRQDCFCYLMERLALPRVC